MLDALRSLFRKKPEPQKPPAPAGSHRFVEFGAGLGDVVTLMYTSARYNSLESIGPEERVTIVLMSHNPFAHELFKWHRNAARMEVRDLGFWWPKEDAEKRAFHKLPSAQPFVYEVQKSCRFYPSPEDLATLSYLESLGGYVVVSASAGGTDRNIPAETCERAIDVFLEAGYPVVVTGRTYGDIRKEVPIRPRADVINLIDCLSVPGTAMALEQASGVFCSHSAMCLLAWHMKRPVFLLYPEDVRRRDFHSVHQYTIGKDFPTTMHMEFSEFSDEKAKRFVKIMGGPRPS